MPPSSPISLGNLVQLTTIQSKKLNKNNKSIYNGDCILATQKKKKNLPPKNQKTCVRAPLLVEAYCYKLQNVELHWWCHMQTNLATCYSKPVLVPVYRSKLLLVFNIFLFIFPVVH